MLKQDERGKERVVLVHCSSGSPRQWDSLITELDGFDTATINLIGHVDNKRWNGARSFRLLDEAEGISHAIRPGAPAHLIGHSYGGAVALRYALAFPQRIRTLTLIEPSSFHLLKHCGYDATALIDEIRSVAEALVPGLISGHYSAGMETFIDYWGGQGTWERLSPSQRSRLAPLALYVAHHFHALLEEEATPLDYANVVVPTLILSGTHSPKPSQEIVRLLSRSLPRVLHRTIEGASHMSPLTHAAEVNAVIISHLRSHLNRCSRLPRTPDVRLTAS